MSKVNRSIQDRRRQGANTNDALEGRHNLNFPPSDEREPVLGGGCSRQPQPLLGSATLDLVRAAARRGDVGPIHESLQSVGPAHLLADEGIRGALRPLAKHFDIAAASAALLAFWEQLRCDAEAAERILADEVQAAFLQELAAMLDARLAPADAQLVELALRARQRATSTLVLDALRSETGERVLRLELGDAYTSLRAQLGLKAHERIASMLSADDAHELVRAFERAYALTEDPREAGERLQHELVKQLAARAHARARGPSSTQP